MSLSEATSTEVCDLSIEHRRIEYRALKYRALVIAFALAAGYVGVCGFSFLFGPQENNRTHPP